MSENNILQTVKKACLAKAELFNLDTKIKNDVLLNIAKNIENNKEKIFAANKKDLENAEKMIEEGKLTRATFGRLKLDDNKMRDMIQGIYDVIKLDDPSNKVLWARELDENLVLKKVTCPIGLIGIIFEARPDVISQITSLAIKSGNAVILKGGKEADNTNKAIYEIIKEAVLKVEEFPYDSVNLVFSHEDIKSMLELDEYIDLIIPRGSNKLVTYIQQNTKIPVLGHASGICHIYVDESAKKEMVQTIIKDSKTQYPTACNSVETVLVNKNYPYIDELKTYLKDSGIKVIENPEKFDYEYSDKILAFKVVNNLDEAIKHINTSGVFHNVSTRFSDGFRYGFGAEVGISTNKTLARGPVGLDGLCVYKYKLFGKGQIVDDYVKGIKKFHHKDI